MIKKILEKIPFVGNYFKKSEDLRYPEEFVIIDYSEPAKRDGIKDNINKIIYHYYIDKYGFRQVKKQRYSEGMIHSIKEVSQIPILDKTKIEEGFPVYGKIPLSDIKLIK